MNVIKVYVAAPYTKGDVAINVRNAIEAGDILYEKGFVPFIPHFTHFWHLLFPKEYSRWLEYDNYWLAVCDCVLRLPGESNGADIEVQFARKLGKPVYNSFDDLYEAFPDIVLSEEILDSVPSSTIYDYDVPATQMTAVDNSGIKLRKNANTLRRATALQREKNP